MSNTQSAHVCTSTTFDVGSIFIRAAHIEENALEVLKKEWFKRKPSPLQDALLQGWSALEDRLRDSVNGARARGLLLHVGVPAAIHLAEQQFQQWSTGRTGDRTC